MHRLAATALLLSVALASPSIAQAPAGMTATAVPTTLSLVAEASVDAAPDVADIGAGVMTQAPDARTALSQNATAMNRVLDAIRKAGIPDRDVRTTGLSVAPQYRFQPNEAPALVGFQASNRVQVRIRDPKTTGAVVDALVAAGANQLDGPSFTVDKPGPLMDRARTDAVRTAKARAELYAAAAGLKVRRILSIRETGAEDPSPRPLGRVQMAAAEAYLPAPSPVVPGQVQISASVQVTFELE